MADLHYRETTGGTQNKRSRPSNNSNSNSNSSSQKNNNNNNNNNNEYCQPVGNKSSKPPPTVIPLLSISGLSQQDVCDSTLKRIHMEFIPIIQRRNYYIKSISEMCCCGDGLKGSRIMGKNVWGYNSTTRGGTGRQSSRIHLRLRDPNDHTRLLPWEDVAGTMAHEMAHCVHQNHNKNFFKLMEEILDEHFNNQIYGPTGPSFLQPKNGNSIGRDTINNNSGGGNITSSSIPESGGHKLGRGISSSSSSSSSTGNSSSRSKNRSRLVNELSGGYKLGGNNNYKTTATVTGLNRDQLRHRIVKAAEARKRQMAHIRRMIERSKEPCVIDLCDSDSDSDNDDEGKYKYIDDSEGKCENKGEKKKETGNDDNEDDKIINVYDGDKDDDNENDEKKPSNNSNTKENRSSSISSGKEEINSNRNDRKQQTKDKKKRSIVTIDDNNNNNKSEKEKEDDNRNNKIKKARREVDVNDVIDLTTPTTTGYYNINISRTTTATTNAKNNQSSNNNTNSKKNSNNNKWSCGRCTFKNDFQNKRCQVCNESKDYFDPYKSYR
jgi:hypothetical protein